MTEVDYTLREEILAKAIFNLPVNTKFGDLLPLSIQNFMKHIASITTVAMSKKLLLAETGRLQQLKTGQSDREIFTILQDLNRFPLLELLKELYVTEFVHYVIITRLCKFFYLDEQRNEFDSDEEFEKYALKQASDFLNTLTNEEFEEYRQILLILHEQSEPEAFLNPTLYKRVAKQRERKSKKKNNSPTITTMASTIVSFTGIPYSEIAKWNSLQVQHTFQRIAVLIQNNHTTLFRTVTNEVDIIDWSQNFDSDKNKSGNDQKLDTFMNDMSSKLK